MTKVAVKTLDPSHSILTVLGQQLDQLARVLTIFGNSADKAHDRRNLSGHKCSSQDGGKGRLIFLQILGSHAEPFGMSFKRANVMAAIASKLLVQGHLGREESCGLPTGFQ